MVFGGVILVYFVPRSRFRSVFFPLSGFSFFAYYNLIPLTISFYEY